jgi:hypothetical protein
VRKSVKPIAESGETALKAQTIGHERPKTQGESKFMITDNDKLNKFPNRSLKKKQGVNYSYFGEDGT